jgi:hypothetical protein
MRFRASPVIAAAFLAPAIATPSHAQFRGMLDHLANRVVNAATHDDADADQRDADGESRQAHKLTINRRSDFQPGSRVLLASDFANTPKGTMPREWKTNGSGSIVTVGEIQGAWLALAPGATYKLTTPPNLPDRFTVEFDLVPAADQTRDFDPVMFGFAHDNSTRRYIPDAYNAGAINGVQLNFAGSSSVMSSATDYSHFNDLDLRDTANRAIHIAIAVDGDQMRAYLDGGKIADAKLFSANAARYFYLSAPLNYRHGATMLFGNFRIAASD